MSPSRKRLHSEDSDVSDNVYDKEDTSNGSLENDVENENELPHKKQQTKLSDDQIEFRELEDELDSHVLPEYRKYRPRGFPFNNPPTDRAIRIYADGVFDLFHLGHMRQLEQSKKALPNVTLVCGIPSDEDTHSKKGLTVLTDVQRCETLNHCKWVDEVIPNAPWCVTPEFLKEHNIDYVAHDDIPYASGDSGDIYEPIKKAGMFLTTQRTDGISTSDIITKIIRDYDKYLMRNFARGATRKELNVSWLKKNELDFKKHISDFRGYWAKNNMNDMSRDLYSEVRELLRKTIINNNQLRLKLKNSRNSRNGSTSSLFSLKDGLTSPASEFAENYTGSPSHSTNGRNGSTFLEKAKVWVNRVRDKDSEYSPVPFNPFLDIYDNDDDRDNDNNNSDSQSPSQSEKDNEEEEYEIFQSPQSEEPPMARKIKIPTSIKQSNGKQLN